MLRRKFIFRFKEIFKVKYNYLGDLDFVLRFSTRYKFAAIQKVLGIYRSHPHQMQKQFYKVKSDQFSLWLKDIIKSNIFGKTANLNQFQEWERFFFNLTLIKQSKSFNNLLNVL